LGKGLDPLRAAAQDEVDGLLAETSADEDAHADRRPIAEAIDRIIETLERKQAKSRKLRDQEGRRLIEAKEGAAEGRSPGWAVRVIRQCFL
jgi:hypothetical protein